MGNRFESNQLMITKTVTISACSAMAVTAAIACASLAAKMPSPFESLSCLCQEQHAAGSPTLRKEIELGVQEGELVTPAELLGLYPNVS